MRRPPDRAVRWISEGRIFVNAWVELPAARDIDAVRIAQLAAHRTNGQLGVVTLLRPPLSMPRFDDELRRASAEARRLLEPTYVCSAFVIDRGGFVASIARSILSGIHALAPAEYPTKVFDDALAAAEWTAAHLARDGASVAMDDILAVLRRLERP